MDDRVLQSQNAKRGRTIPKVRAGLPYIVEAAAAGAGLLVVSPILAIAAVAVAATSRGPVIFRQQRMGRNGRLFTMYKFRSMSATNSGPQVTAGHDMRVTKVGRVLRKTKLDELPQLWNIVRGDMSLVGGRPEVPGYVDTENPLWQIVLQARPGLADPMILRLGSEDAFLSTVAGDHERFYRETLLPFKLQEYSRYLQQRSWWSDVVIMARIFRHLALPPKGPLKTPQELMEPSSPEAQSEAANKSF